MYYVIHIIQYTIIHASLIDYRLWEHRLRTSTREGEGSPQWDQREGGSKLIRTSPLNINIIKL